MKLLVFTGPTAVGKTEYSLKLAEHLSGEIISCDSMQLYKGLDIGSAKPTEEEMKRVRHHLIGCIDPSERFSVAIYQKLALAAIEDVSARGKLPILVGGTGLYIDSVLYDMDFAAPPAEDSEYRAELYAIASEKGREAVYEMLKEKDPAAAERIHPNNLQRVVRALEAAEAGDAIADFAREIPKNPRFEYRLIGLNRDRDELYDRVNQRVDKLLELGLVDEVKGLLESGLNEDNISMKGIGYKEVIQYLDGSYDYDEMIRLIKRNTRHLAKRQLTWMRRYEDMHWFNISSYDSELKLMEDIIGCAEEDS